MLQSFECPNCQATLDYDANTNAMTVRCSYCGSTVALVAVTLLSSTLWV